MVRTADPIEECPVGTADEQYLDDRLAASYPERTGQYGSAAPRGYAAERAAARAARQRSRPRRRPRRRVCR
jgi:hypothetical protein